MIKKKVVSSPSKHNLMDISGGDFPGDKFIKLTYRPMSKLGKLLKTKKVKKIPVPKGFVVAGVSNHTPTLNKVTIKFRK